MTLKRVLVNIFLPLVLLITIIIVGHQTQVQVRKSAENEVTNNLLAGIDITESSFIIWVNEVQHFSEIASRSDFIQIYFTNRTLLIDDQLERISNSKDVIGVVVQDEEGVIVESSQKNLIGKRLKENTFTYWNKVRSSQKAVFVKPYIEDFSVSQSDELILITAPVRMKEEGFVGAITLIYDPKVVFKSIFEIARVGRTGETYAFDESGLMISDSRFNNDLRKAGLISLDDQNSKFKVRLYDPGKNLLMAKDKTFKKKQLTKMAQSALEDGAGMNVKGYRDYRGVEVVGAWLWLDDYNFGFAVEMDFDEAYTQMGILDQKIKIIYLLLVIFLIITLYLNLEGEKLKSKLVRTNRSLLAKSRELDAFFDAIDAHSIISKTDPRGKITFANANFVEVSKYDHREIIGQDHRLVNSGFHDKEFFEQMWKTIQSKDTWHGQIRNKNKEGDYYWVESTIFPVLDELKNIKEYIAIRTNITDIKNQQIALREARNEAERISTMRANFMANVSHELRTPLNAIIGFLTVLKDEVSNSDHREKFEIVYHAAESLLEIINDVLDFSRLEQGKLELNIRPTNLKALIKQIYDLYAIRVKEKNVIIEVDDDLEDIDYLVDGIKIKQIISNLVGNSIKFTTHGSIKISISQSKKSENISDLVISIKDTGRGIPQEKLETIFTPFGQLSADDVLYDSGVGLGLAIVDGYVKLMKAQIDVESEVGLGTTFRIMIPNVESVKRINDEILKVEKLDFDNKILALVVDDNNINLKMMEAYLRKYGVRVEKAQSGQQAIDMFEESKYDIIFMDQLMPGLKGTETTDLLRKSFHELPPIISLSASILEEDLRLFEEKFDGVMTKPINKAQLESILRKFL
ncbi:ATP-binding protein [Bacteriovorax sp. DB6_IX]|uniref:ATP-binding protein n=1 Tax=Bacteriovorax sp. DB6_IX TaxID=1353530 RepID=UPI00038A3A3B|nr:ATP-binding protein [Bacteriovorax sp. DB6_IX]EQC51312.1 PAS domain S-box protein [Bacteriovorax sp. DB6_IX]